MNSEYGFSEETLCGANKACNRQRKNVTIKIYTSENMEDQYVQKIKKHSRYLFLLLLCLLNCHAAFSGESDGYLLDKSNGGSIWWVENSYKVFRDSPVPKKKKSILLRSAKNETEGFQLVFHPTSDMEEVTVTVGDFKSRSGNVIPAENVTIRNMEYVHVTKPSGFHHKAGWYPDPLPPYKGAFQIKGGMNTPVWISVTTPKGAVAGSYWATIQIESSVYRKRLSVELNVWNFVLPEHPYMRSSFGLSEWMIKKYHRIDNKEELAKQIDWYYRSFKQYRISPMTLFGEIKKEVTGYGWTGGTYDPDTVYEGRYSYQITDRSAYSDASGTPVSLIPIVPGKPYCVKWMAKNLDNQSYYVTVKSYTAGKKPIDFQLQGKFYPGDQNWHADTLFLDPENPLIFDDILIYRPIPENAAFIDVRFYPNVPGRSGDNSATIWIDDVQIYDVQAEKNLLPEGDFEQDINLLDVTLDFKAFDEVAKRYFDEYGFNGFSFSLPELYPGPFVGRKTGWFQGFINGTPEYKKLMTLYLKGIQDHLEANGWLGKEYLYWIDEPKREDYDFVREGMKTIHEAAPKLKRFITENNPGPEIMDVTEIGCPVLAKLDLQKSKKWIDEGREMWTYLMCWPKAPHNSLFIDADAINLRMWLWMSYRYRLKGILVWSSTFWNESDCSPSGMLQDPWTDPMAYNNVPLPKGASCEFGNGDGRFFYPPQRDPNGDTSKCICEPIPSLRLEILREGLEDYDYMILLEKAIEQAGSKRSQWVKKAKWVLSFGSEVFVNEREYTKDSRVLMTKRETMGELLHQFYDRKP